MTCHNFYDNGCALFKRLGVILFLLPILTSAQTNQPDNVVSPEIHPDHRVTFRIRAPRASEIGLSGDWMATGTQEKMTRDEQGIWSATTGPLEPGIAIYNFIVDGIAMADPVNPRLKLRARTSASLLEIPANPPALWQARDVPHGTVEVNWEKSNVIGDTRAVYVYTPPDYHQNSTVHYPVLYLLHGNNDTAAGWTDVGKANFILDNLIAEKKAVPMIIVMPWGHAIPIDSARTNSQGGRQQYGKNNTALFERYLLEDVIPHVEKKYRASSGRENRAIVGLSMGGGHSLQIGLSHLDRFSAVGAFSAAVPGDFQTRFKALLDDPNGMNQKLKLLWVGCGKQDSMFDLSLKLSQLLDSHKVKNTFRATEGRHNYAIWRQYLSEVAPLLFQ